VADPAAAATMAATYPARAPPRKGSKALSRAIRELLPPTNTNPALLTEK
jgi:hypothetical protein